MTPCDRWPVILAVMTPEPVASEISSLPDAPVAVGLFVGEHLVVEVGKPAVGGGCVARAPDGRVLFVRHCLPGEIVRVRVTSVGAHLARADAVEVLGPSPGRVAPPCPHAGPGRCGGCDWQHASLEAQRAMKASLVEEALRRLAGIEATVVVEPAPDGAALGWRTRLRYGADPAGRLGLRRHRSHRLELVEGCPLGTDEVAAAEVARRRWPGAIDVEVLVPAGGSGVVTVRRRPGRQPRLAKVGLPVVVAGAPARRQPAAGEVLGRRFEISPGAFWQVHHQAPALLASAVLTALEPGSGERVLDLYAGVGLFAVHLALAVGISGSVLAVEEEAAACADAARNSSDLPQVDILQRRIDADLVAALAPADIVVLDPPRAGAGAAVMGALGELRPAPRRVAYVACDPASLARDLRAACAGGWRLAELRAFDLFPMTEHVEMLAVLEPSGAG